MIITLAQVLWWQLAPAANDNYSDAELNRNEAMNTFDVRYRASLLMALERRDHVLDLQEYRCQWVWDDPYP